MSELLKEFDGLKRKVPDSRFILPGSGQEILFRPFTTEDQKAILKSIEKRDIELINESFDAMLRKCVLNENFNPLDLYSRDREALLIDLRRNSVKEEFVYTWKCSKETIDDRTNDEKICKHENKTTIRLSDINMTRMKNKFELKDVVLEDVEGCVLTLGMTTRRDEKEILKYTKNHSKDMKGDEQSRVELLYATFASVIRKVSINDKVRENIKFDDRVDLVGKLSIDDRNKIRDFIQNLEEYGADLKLTDCVCGKCGFVQDVEVEWISFFGM